MFNLISTINVEDVDTFAETFKSAPQEYYANLGIVEQTIYREVGQNTVIIAGTYNTLEDVQNHKAILESPDAAAQLKQSGVKSFELRVAEKV